MSDKPLQTIQGFGTQTTEVARVDTAASAMAAQAKAAVESRYIMAMHRPRNWDDVRSKILKECRRPSFAANKSAYYKKPGSSNATGLGVRFAEVAVRCMTNVLIETPTTHDDDEKELINVMVTDLESNISYNQSVRVTKTVERSKPMSDGSFISVRKNSSGANTYTVPATDDDLLAKRGALISKAVRNLVLRILPGDLQDEAIAMILSTRNNKQAQDPEAYRKRIVDAFAALNITAVMLEDMLDQELETVSPQQIEDLREIHGAIRDGKTTWRVVMERIREGLPALEVEPPPADMDPETGEIPPQDVQEPQEAHKTTEPAPTEAKSKSGAPGFSAEEIGIMIEDAEEIEQIDEIMDLINSLDKPLRGDLFEQAEKQLSVIQQRVGLAK